MNKYLLNILKFLELIAIRIYVDSPVHQIFLFNSLNLLHTYTRTYTYIGGSYVVHFLFMLIMQCLLSS